VGVLLPAAAILITLATILVLVASRGSAKTPAPPVASSPVQPDTAAGAQTAAQQAFQLYTAGQYAAVYADLVPSVQSSVAKATWVAVHQRCQVPLAGASYTVASPLLAGQSAVFTVSFGSSSETQVFYYLTGKWLWAPSGQNLAAYQGSVTHIVSQMKSEGYCP
jgi:hypothetical protein